MVNFNISEVQHDVQRHLILQVLAVISVVKALAALYLSLLFTDTLSAVTASYAGVLNWVAVSTTTHPGWQV